MYQFRVAFISVIGLLLFVTGSPGQDQIKLTGVTKEMLEKAEKFELLSLDPSPSDEKPKDGFQGWKMLGKTHVKDAETRKQLIDALKQGIEKNTKGGDGMLLKNCFRPRHGIRLTDKDKIVDLVICFECNQIRVYVDGFRLQNGLMPTVPAQQAAFDKVLQDAKVKLAPKAKE